MVHPLLILMLVWAIPGFRVMRYLLCMTLGWMSAMVFSELGLPGFDLLFGDLLLILLLFLVSYSMAYKINFRFLGLLLFFSGAIHGLSYFSEIREMELDSLQRIQAMFAFHLALDIGHYLLALLLLAILPLLRKYLFSRNWLPVISGSLSVFLVLLVFGEHVVSDNARILAREQQGISFNYKTYAPPADLSARQASRGKGMMTTPVMIFLSVEAHEIRQEILFQASEAIPFSSMDGNDLDMIPVAAQEDFKEEIQDTVNSASFLYVDGALVRPAETITNFVSLSRGGVAIRESPVDEQVHESIIGITLVYDVETFPDSIFMDWNLFSGSIPFIEASAVDPHGAFSTMLSPGTNTLSWKSRLAGFRVPDIEAIAVETQAQPLLSVLVFFCIIVFMVYLALSKRQFSIRPWMTAILIAGFLAYPFVRMKMDLPFLTQGKPSAEKAGVLMNDLLSNVYRAFDRRNESDVYDRLAISVSGDQLTEIYMQNRQSMALESRGGARAKVDEVNIQELMDIKRVEDRGYVADTRWTVSGSVNHFGHTHYRQNQYRALVSFGIDGNSWKISDIEIIDTRRLY